MSRRDEPLLREQDDVPEALQTALRLAVNDELPSAARLKRIEGHLVAEVIASSSQRGSASDVERWRQVAVARQHERAGERTSGWRTIVGTASRFTSIGVGVVTLAGLAAAWAGVAGYRAYREATEWTARSAPVPSVTELSRPGPAPVEPASTEPQRLAPSPDPVTSPNAPDAAPIVVETEAPRPAPSALPPRKAPVLSRNDPWGITSARKSAPPNDKHTPAPNAAGEEDLLERATRSLATDPQAALALMDLHRATIRNGKLAQEREVVIIQALAKLGRLDAAESVAKRFLAEHPESPYAKDVLTMAGAPRR